MRRIEWVVVAAMLIAGCSASGDSGEIEDAEDAVFTGGKADAPVDDGTPEACAVKKLANLGSHATLDDEVGLSSRAAGNIVLWRELGGWYATLDQLDAIKYVGPATFRAMRDFAIADERFVCGAVDVQLLAFNDFHGNLEPPTGSSGRIQTGPDPNVDRVDAGGAEYLATHLATLAAENPHTTIVAAGDLVGATPLLSAAFRDEPSIESMNLMDLAVASVGNHEFDHGKEALLRLQYGEGDFAGAAFEYLAANVIDDYAEHSIFPPYAVRSYGNARVAFIGLTLEGTPLVTTAAGVAGLHFLDEADTINALVPELQAKGIHAIVVLIHEGGAQTGLYDQCNGISGAILGILDRMDPAVQVVVTGHTHLAYNCTIDGRTVTSAAHAGRLITDIDLTIDERTGAITSQASRNVIVTRDVAKDAAQTALIAKYKALIAPIANRVVGAAQGDLLRSPTGTTESTMGNVIADAQLDATRAGGAVIAVMNPGGVRADLLAATVSGGEAAGEITYAEAFSVQPFGNNLISFDVTGAQLDTMLEQQFGATKTNLLAVSGLTYAYSASAPIGSKVDPASIRVGGEVVSPTATYRVTANGFLADGGDGFAVLKLGTNRSPGSVDLEALEAYLGAHRPLAVPALDRVTVLP
jgi:5'-nucleotidase